MPSSSSTMKLRSRGRGREGDETVQQRRGAGAHQNRRGGGSEGHGRSAGYPTHAAASRQCPSGHRSCSCTHLILELRSAMPVPARNQGAAQQGFECGRGKQGSGPSSLHHAQDCHLCSPAADAWMPAAAGTAQHAAQLTAQHGTAQQGKAQHSTPRHRTAWGRKEIARSQYHAASSVPVMMAAAGMTRKKGSLGEPTSVPMLLWMLSAMACLACGDGPQGSGEKKRIARAGTQPARGRGSRRVQRTARGTQARHWSVEHQAAAAAAAGAGAGAAAAAAAAASSRRVRERLAWGSTSSNGSRLPPSQPLNTSCHSPCRRCRGRGESRRNAVAGRRAGRGSDGRQQAARLALHMVRRTAQTQAPRPYQSSTQ